MATSEEVIAMLQGQIFEKEPVTFNEKLRWKMRYDRRALLTLTADKYNVTHYLKQSGFEHLLRKLYFATTDPSSIPFDRLPSSYVVKSTHSAGDVMIIVEGMDITTNQKVTASDIIDKCQGFLSRRHWNEKNEWAYANIPAMIIVEEFLYDGDPSHPPRDFKFLCFGGKPEIVEVIQDRFKEYSDAYFDMNWNQLPFTWSDWPGQKGAPPRLETPRPPNFSELVATAAALSEPFDFVRVDLYNCSGRIYFGEFTHYPSAAVGEFDPESYDSLIGQLWTLPPLSLISS